jgi:TetR/AcrR family transcriptional repressor of bet genes
VVGFAKMSPGIVRFYFDSKAAMLVASLQHLATEFEEQVLVPVAKLKATPVAALRLMVDLFLDPDIASPRKVSVWYAFWGEASSRQEYYDICGQKDESFAILVHELIAALIDESRLTQLDADGIALGLIGALEILWQDIAFQAERDIDRPAAKRRCMAFLNSVFPGRFDLDVAAGSTIGGAPTVPNAPASAPGALPAWTYDDAGIFAMERESLFHGAWAVVGHESQIPHAGDFLTVDVGVERVLVTRDASGRVHALRNSCPESPHALQVERTGRFEQTISCKRHGLQFSLAGVHTAGAGRADLQALDLRSVGGLLFVRAPPAHGVATAHASAEPDAWFDTPPPAGLMMLGAPLEICVAADWKILIEQWLEASPVSSAVESSPFASSRVGFDSLVWDERVVREGWSAARYRRLVACLPEVSWRRRFIAPNQLIETRPDGLSVLQVLPVAAGRSCVRRLDYSVMPPDDSARATLYLARRLGPYVRNSTLALAESLQQGLVEFGYEAAGERVAPALAWFHRLVAGRVPALLIERSSRAR